MTHTFRNDVTVGHRVFRRRVAVVEETVKHGNLFSLLQLAGVHLGTGLVNAFADKLDTGSTTTEIKASNPTNLCHNLVRVAHLTPTRIGNLADKIPGPGRHSASLDACQLSISGGIDRHTRIPRFGKSCMAVERGSSEFNAHL